MNERETVRRRLPRSRVDHGPEWRAHRSTPNGNFAELRRRAVVDRTDGVIRLKREPRPGADGRG
jgi:hypothetical protein